MATLLAPVIAIAVLLVAAGALVVQREWQRRLVGTSSRDRPAGGGATPVADILYFTGESCTICHVAQRPALQRLRELVADVDIREIDVAAEPQAARSYRVMTLPTTIVLDRQGRMTAVNAGFAGELRLRDQVRAARASSVSPALA